MTDVDLVAHRGASSRAPENTLAAVRLALADGATGVECDVHRTRDGVLVVLHDPTLARTTDVRAHFPRRAPWVVSDFSLAELRRLDAGSWCEPDGPDRWGGERIPTLEEWVAEVGPGTGMLIEVKSPAAYPGIDRELAELVGLMPASRTALAQGRLCVQAFDHEFLRGLKQLSPEVPVNPLLRRRPRPGQLLELASWAEGVNFRSAALRRGAVNRAPELGLSVGVWTVDDELGFARAGHFGVDRIITNDPARLRSYLRAA
jgi:glycerophosphoryl diester phosphodiesterase